MLRRTHTVSRRSDIFLCLSFSDVVLRTTFAMGRFCKFEFGYVMNKRVVSISVLSTVLLLTGCGSVQTQQAPVEVAQAPQPPQNQEVLKALAQLDEIKQELKLLRNTVEELQFETENSKRRQQDLFQDLDRRLVDLERNQRVLSPSADGGEVQIDPVTGEVIAADGSTQTQQPDGSAGNVGSATQVVVESGQNTTGSDTTAVDSSQTTAVVVSAPATNGSVTLDEQNAYEQAFDLLKQSRYEDAILGFQTLVDTWPTSQLADDAYYWMSEARYVNREFEHALSGFRTVVSRYPDSQRVPEALLKIGYIQYDIGAYEDAAETFRDILARFPGHQVTVSAQTRLRRIEQTIQ